MHHFGKIDLFENTKLMVDYSAHFHEKFMLKISVFVKFKFTKKVVCTTYNVLGILALISGAIFVEIIFSSKSETAYFSARFHKNYPKQIIGCIK